MSERVDVAVIGGGPAGLAAASELMALGAGSVLVVERETDAGGIPRHCGHQGFGARDMHRLMSGPRYAARWARTAERAGAQLVLGTQVTGWAGPGTLQLTGPGGRRELQAQAVVLATGCRERPRSARLIPGSRPMRGVMNTGTLQQLVHGAHERVGSRAVVVGAEHVSFSALMTLRHGGARAIAMTTELPRHQSFAAVRAGAGVLHRTRLLTSTSLSDIRGDERLRSVQVTDLASGKSETISCDVLVLSADWIPEHELAVLAGAELDRGTMGPSVDRLGRTSTRGLFAAGNVLHGAEPADFAALERAQGRTLGDRVSRRRYLARSGDTGGLLGTPQLGLSEQDHRRGPFGPITVPAACQPGDSRRTGRGPPGRSPDRLQPRGACGAGTLGTRARVMERAGRPCRRARGGLARLRPRAPLTGKARAQI